MRGERGKAGCNAEVKEREEAGCKLTAGLGTRTKNICERGK